MQKATHKEIISQKNPEILMKPLKTTVVGPNIPEALARLTKLRYNLRWT
jgi:hypothetical protein